MTTLLHISASPRGQASESLALARAFLQAHQDASPGVTIDHLDLWDGSLPPFGPAAARAKMAVFAGQQPSGEDAAAWNAVWKVFERFYAADSYLFSVPMWNAGIPYVLKQFIDVVSQPGMVFSFDPESGYRGLLDGKKAAVLHTSAVWGSGRPAAFGSNFAEPFLQDWLRWTGITGITTVSFAPNLATADVAADRRQALARAADAGAGF